MLAAPPPPPRRLHDAAGRRRLRLLGAAMAALFALVSWQLAPLQPAALALQFAATPTAFGVIVHGWSPAQLAGYRAHLPLDAALLSSYAAFGWTLARHGQAFATWSAGRRRVVSWLLPLAAAADAVEDAFHLWLTAAPRFGVPWAYLTSAAASWAKWALLFGFAGALVWALASQRD